MTTLQGRLFLRIIAKNREAYGLKIVSLAIAFACSTLIILFSINEFGYDRFHDDDHAIFRILQRNNKEDYSGNRLSNRIPTEVLTRIKAKAGDRLIVARVKGMEEISIGAAGKTFRDQKIHAADAELTDIFSFSIINGALSDFKTHTRSVILSSSAAQEYFGGVEVRGREMKISAVGDTLVYRVAAVYKDFPKNAHTEFNTLIRFDDPSVQTLGFNPKDHIAYGRSRALLQVEKLINEQPKSDDVTYRCQPIADIYFGPRVMGEDVKHGDHYSIIILICISGLIFFLALTSFVNLTTLTLPHRSKELAVKKLAGTSHWTLLMAFGKESFSLVGISLVLGLVGLAIASPAIERLLGMDLIALFLGFDRMLIVIIAALSLILGIAPLFMTFRFTQATPSRLLGTAPITFPRFKRVITFLQLGISIFLIVASMVIRRQVNYSLLKEPGRNHDQVVYLSYPKDLTDEGLRSMRAGWKKYNPNIVDVIATSQLPNRISSKELNSEFYIMSVDPMFKDFFNLNMTEGNWFRANDGDSVVVVNKKGKQLLSDRHLAIGVFEGLSDEFDQPEKPVKINVASYLHYNFLCVRILEVDIRRTVAFLSTQFENETGKARITFLNKRFEEWLTYQDRLNTLSEILAIISGILSCCAIYGLSVSIVRDKLKQIAIRKLFGASSLKITQLLIREFARQMLIAMLIFGPFTFIVLKELLRTFVYATHFSWTDPLFPILYCVVVISAICGFQALSLNRADLTSALKD
ncbi:ABC transporter permease [Chryseolinea soli]|nr:ABC transporter permease [Chryseolinea soli]